MRIVFQIGLWLTVVAAFMFAVLMPLSIWINHGLRLSFLPLGSPVTYRCIAPQPSVREPGPANPSRVIIFSVVIAVVVVGCAVIALKRSA